MRDGQQEVSFLCFLGYMACVTLVSQSGLNSCSLNWKHGVLTTRRAGKFRQEFSDAGIFTVSLLLILNWIKVVLHTL